MSTQPLPHPANPVGPVLRPEAVPDLATPPSVVVRPEALLRRAGRTRSRSGLAAGAARALLTRLLSRMTEDSLRITDSDGSQTTYGRPNDSASGADDRIQGLERLEAAVRICDERAWTSVATEGSIGLGRSYLEGWWTSDDPTTVVRIIIRNLRGLDELRNRVELATGGFTDQVRRLLPRPDRTKNRKDIASHYDLGNEFFALFLDETMTYSSALFPEPGADLATGSRAKYDRLLAKLGVSPAHELLEIGTGWGGLAVRAAQSFGCHVTTTTVSRQQQLEADSRVMDAGLADRVTVLRQDWRDLGGSYDRIIAIEMIEAVDWRDYERFFAMIADRLRPDGMVGLQAICVPDRRYERTKKTEDFIRRFVFPGGFLPSIGAINRAVSRATRLQVLDVEDFSAHYAETLHRWRLRFERALSDVRSLGLDERFCRLWRFYLAYCEAGFLERHCTVNQFVLVGPDWRPDGLAMRPA